MTAPASPRPYRVRKKPPANLPAKEPIQPSRAEAALRAEEDGWEFVHRFSNGAKVWTTVPRTRSPFRFYWQPLEIIYPPQAEIADWLISVAKIVAEQNAATVALTITFGADHVAMIVPPSGDPYRAEGKVRIEGASISLRIDASRWINSGTP